jgi:hypothetical protein
MSDRRKSPTPLEGSAANATKQLPAWIGYAEDTAAHIEREFEATEETLAMIDELRAYAKIFEGWKDPVLRPAVDDRGDVISAFMSVRRRAFDLVVRLAKEKLAR